MAAIWQRKPAKGLIWHTARGSQYASESHRLLLAQHGIVQSMSRKGNCWDNAVSESFFHTLKTELIHHENYPTRAEAKKSVFTPAANWFYFLAYLLKSHLAVLNFHGFYPLLTNS